jgi:magnesium chelatase family protein
MTTATAWGSVLMGLVPTHVRVHAKATPADGSVNWLTIADLSDAAAREARIRVGSAIGGFNGQRIEVHLEGLPDGADTPALDLAIAVAVLRATDASALHGVATDPSTVFVGELSLGGVVRPIRGALCHLDGTAAASIVLPEGNAWETGLGHGAKRAYCVGRLADLAKPLTFVTSSRCAAHVPHGREELPESLQAAFDSARGLPRVLFVGPPGAGLLMLARRLATEAPALQGSAVLDVARIHGRAGILNAPFTLCPPFRAPHHTVSEAGLIGGGENVRPGEVSLAHRGVLVLDELTEFRRGTLQALASTLREKSATFARRRSIVRMPAEPLAVVGTATLCPPGSHHGERVRFEERLQEVAALMGMTRIEVPALLSSQLGRSL